MAFYNAAPSLTRRTVVLLSLTGSLIALSGCATITRGTHEALVVESEPSGAQVRLSNGLSGTTPTSFKISRKGDVHVTIAKEGFETADINVTTQIAGAGAAGMAGNVLVGGLIGAGVDAFSGGMLEHKPNPVKVTLVPVKAFVSAIVAPPPTPAGVPEPAPSSAGPGAVPPSSSVAAVTAPEAAPSPPAAAQTPPIVPDAPKPAPAAEVPEAPKSPPAEVGSPTVAKPGI